MTRDFAPLKVGVRIRSTSDLPRSSGLSSSSAFITLLVIALAEVNGLRSRRVWRDYLRTPLQLAEYCGAVEMGGPYGPFPGEDGVGTRGGAQDHVAICCNHSERVSAFRYLPAEPVGSAAFPEQWTFLVGVSGVRATKTGAARDDYNRAADQLRDLVSVWNRETGRTDLSLRSVLQSSVDAPERLAQLARGLEDPDGVTARIAQFRSETERVVPEALAAFAAADAHALGSLAVASQQGAEVTLHNQIPETAFLARSAMAAGAHAASAFGAGFGGAVWAVVDRAAAEVVTARWRASYAAAFPQTAARAQWVTVRPVAGIQWP
jgi:galactokinase